VSLTKKFDFSNQVSGHNFKYKVVAYYIIELVLKAQPIPTVGSKVIVILVELLPQQTLKHHSNSWDFAKPYTKDPTFILVCHTILI